MTSDSSTSSNNNNDNDNDKNNKNTNASKQSQAIIPSYSSSKILHLQKSSKTLTLQNFTCPICLSILHRPSINTICGHVFCFTCFHSSMDGYSLKSKCAICRSEYNQLCAPCNVLGEIVRRLFPREIQQEGENAGNEDNGRMTTAIEEIEHSHDTDDDDVIAIDANILNCVECHQIVQNPIVPPCGHLVCRDCILLERCCFTEDDNDPCCSDEYCHGYYGNNRYKSRRRRRRRRSCPKCLTPIKNDGELIPCRLFNLILENVLEHNQIKKKDKDEITPKTGIVISNNKKKKHRDESTRKEVCLTNNAKPPPPSIPALCPFLPSEKDEEYIHYMIVCNGCGICPIRGRIAYTCYDCSSSSSSSQQQEETFDLCQDCYYRNIRHVLCFGRSSRSGNHDFERHVMIQRRTGLLSAGSISGNGNLETAQDVIEFILRFLISFIGGSWRFVLEEDSDDEGEEEEEEEESVASVENVNNREEADERILNGREEEEENMEEDGNNENGLYYWQNWWLWRQGNAVA